MRLAALRPMPRHLSLSMLFAALSVLCPARSHLIQHPTIMAPRIKASAPSRGSSSGSSSGSSAALHNALLPPICGHAYPCGHACNTPG
jgi:hypothetical protein